MFSVRYKMRQKKQLNIAHVNIPPNGNYPLNTNPWIAQNIQKRTNKEAVE
jgi:hypothetical protein